MNKKGTRALASATVVGLVLATVTTGNVKAAPGDVYRVQGNDRYETAANVAKANWKDGAKNVIIASGNGYADSLSASVLAKKLNAPIILTTAGELNSNAKSALETLKPENVYVIGGNASVSQSVREGLKKDYKVTELGGQTRFETNIAVANYLVDKLGVKADNVMVVNGKDGFSDALSAAPVAAAKEQVLLIVGKDASTADLAADFVKKHNSKVTVIGTEGVVPAAVYNKLGASERVNGGADRFDTNLKIMEHFKLNADSMYVANATDGQNGYADALVASALAGKNGAPLVLVDTKDSQGTKNAIKYIQDNKTDKTEVSTVGGNGVMPDEIVNEIKNAVKPEINKVAAESVISLNETSVQVKGLAKDTKEADLKDKKIELKAGDITLTAKYVQSSLTEDGKANFVLENGKKLVDTTEYTVESDWVEFVINKFVAKVVNPYVKTINVTTKAIQAKADNNVYFEAKNQYGEDIAVKGNVNNVKVTATINGVPVKETEINKDNINDGYITINNKLKEGDDVFVSFINKIGDKDVKVGTATFKAVKVDDSVSTTISNMKAEYIAEANGHKINEEAKEVLPDDQIKLSAKISDQFGNPMPVGTEARWVVEAGKDLVTKTDDSAIDEVSDSVDFTFKAIKAGDLKVSAYLANGEKATYEVKIGAKKLTEVKVAGESGINIADVKGNNHEEKIVGAITPNNGAILTPDMIKFDIKAIKTSEEVKTSDVEVVAKLRGKNDEKKNENDIVIAVKSSKVGKYVITPYVGESVEKGIKGNIITVTTDINKEVASIDDISFDAAELKTGSEIKKDIVFRNKHKEVIVLDNDTTEVIVTPDGMTGKVTKEDIKDTDKNKNLLTLKADIDKAKTYNVVIKVKNSDVIRAFNLTFKAPAFTGVELGNDINGVVKGDPDTKAKYQEIKFLDQDGKTMSVKNEDIKVSVTKPDGQPLDEGDVSKLITLGKTYTVDKDGKVTFEEVGAGEAVVAMKVLPKDEKEIEPGTYTIKISDKDGKISDTLNITVGSKRIAKTIEVKPEATKVVLGGKVNVKVTPKDQYGEFINVGKEKLEVLPGVNFEASAITEINKDGGAVDAEHPVAGYQVELTGKTKGTNDVVVNVKEADKVLSTNKVSMTVDSASGLIDSVAVDTKDIKPLYSTKDGAVDITKLKAIVKAADGTIIPVSENDLDWKVISQKDSEGNEVKKRTVTVDSKNGEVKTTETTVGSAVIEVTTANMKKATITLKFDNKDSVAQKGTVEVINTATAEDGKTLLPLDADDKKEGIQISLDNDAKDGEKDGAVKVVLNAKDQYGNLLEGDQIKENEITLRVDDSSVVKAEVKEDKNKKAVITITAKGEGDSKVYVEYAGQTIALDVTTNKEAVEKAKEAAAE
ncbi:cell wall-binding repeat-containing protein [Clostridium tepidum]|uniref:cell wall-binding repeat-containing protein n=1 Tax=Clostridium tepidum TaxID=1962263 RepID=UPI001FA89050|nr:cell wall-binding repeat-containing protein [Clostridium tepidum]